MHDQPSMYLTNRSLPLLARALTLCCLTAVTMAVGVFVWVCIWDSALRKWVKAKVAAAEAEAELWREVLPKE